MKNTTALINLAALQHNFTQIRQITPRSKVLAVLKANAYGHGLVAVGKALQQADAFGVARIEEALALRAGGIVKPIVLLEGFTKAGDLPVLVANNIETVVHMQQQVEMILNADLTGPLQVWLKIDSGMHRLGFMPEHFTEAYHALVTSHNVQSGVRLMSHLACADQPEHPMNAQQIALFDEITANRLGEQTLANSAAMLTMPSTHRDWVRPGLILYGVSPLATESDMISQLDWQPVMTLKSQIIAIRQHQKGQPVGYGAHWIAQADTYLGVVAIGYGDGYPRSAPCGTPVLINGRQLPIVGRVSMDMITVDLGANPTEQLGDEVILWGEGLGVEQIAHLCGTIPYELLCNVTQRVTYCYC